MTETEIAWLSRNCCPTLEACLALGWDTRRVCRAAFEKSTQAMASQLDPQLCFLRSYTEIRPHADHCREWIAKTAQMVRSRILVSAQEIVDRSPAMVEVIGGLLREMCASLYQEGQRSAR